MTQLFGLADCNNFYASCEQVFQPQLLGKPTIVLSNNDGRIIARSARANAISVTI
jgi:DNA polymerase V